MSDDAGPPPKLNLDSIAPPPAAPSNVPDQQTQVEERKWRLFQAKKEGRLRLKNYEQNIRERKDYAERYHQLIVVWLFMVLLLLYVSGGKPSGFWLPESVLVTLVGTTTINVLALHFIVAKYLFPNRRSGRGRRTKKRR